MSESTQTTHLTRLTRRQLERFVNAPMVKWAQLHDRMREGDRWDVDHHYAAMVERYARAEAYISRRRSGGTHADAVKASNKVAERVRRAMGFTYPRQNITF